MTMSRRPRRVALARAVASLSRRVLLELSVLARARDRASRALGVLRSFIEVHAGGETGSLVIDFDAAPGLADSGDLDSDPSGLFVEVGEAAQAAGKGVLLTIDELQHLSRNDLANLIIGLHRVSQLGLPLLVAGAGLPTLPGLAGEARSNAESGDRLSNALGSSASASMTFAIPARVLPLPPVPSQGAAAAARARFGGHDPRSLRAPHAGTGRHRRPPNRRPTEPISCSTRGKNAGTFSVCGAAGSGTSA